MNLQDLQIRAEQLTSTREHTLGIWQYHDETHAEAICLNCGGSVQVCTKPQPNDVEIGGELVAVNCYTSCYGIANHVDKDGNIDSDADHVSPRISLWVDDERPMPQNFTHWAKNAQEAIIILKTGQVQKISLDFFLGIDTGLEVAQFIEEQAKLYSEGNGGIPEIRYLYVHTSDPEAKQEIKTILRNSKLYWRNHGNS